MRECEVRDGNEEVIPNVHVQQARNVYCIISF